MKAEKIKKLLEEDSIFWTCPITGAKILAKNTAAIEAYKANLIQKEEEKEKKRIAASKLLKEVKMKTSDVSKIHTMEQLNQFLSECERDLFQNSFTPVAFKPIKLKPKAKREMMNYTKDSVVIKVENLHASAKKTYQKVFGGEIVEYDSGHYLLVRQYMNKVPLFDKIKDWQDKAQTSSVVKVGMNERLILDQNDDYQNLKDKLKKSREKLHELRDLAKKLTQEMQGEVIVEYADPVTPVKKRI